MGDIIREQTIEYIESLIIDKHKDLEKARNVERHRVIQDLQQVLPINASDLLSDDEKRLLRIPNNLLTPDEKTLANDLRIELRRLEDGGCLGGDDDNLFKIRIDGIGISLCFDVVDLFEQGLVNTRLVIANVNIDINPDDPYANYIYPLPKADTERLIEYAFRNGINPDLYPSLTSAVIREIESLEDELYAMRLEE